MIDYGIRLKTPIYCIGDSHVCFFSGVDGVHGLWPDGVRDTLPWCNTRHVGPRTAYNLSISRISYVLDGFTSPENILLCFGEIDCFLHLHPVSERANCSLNEVVETCVSRYLKVASEIQNRGHLVLINNVIPSEPRKDCKVWGTTPYSEAFPSTCLAIEENEVNRLFNKYLKDGCERENMPFVSTFDALVDSDGRANLEYYSEDRHHLSMKAMPIVSEAVIVALADYQKKQEVSI